MVLSPGHRRDNLQDAMTDNDTTDTPEPQERGVEGVDYTYDYVMTSKGVELMRIPIRQP